jgi:hypothetical protein
LSRFIDIQSRTSASAAFIAECRPLGVHPSRPLFKTGRIVRSEKLNALSNLGRAQAVLSFKQF